MRYNPILAQVIFCPLCSLLILQVKHVIIWHQEIEALQISISQIDILSYCDKLMLENGLLVGIGCLQQQIFLESIGNQL